MRQKIFLLWCILTLMAHWGFAQEHTKGIGRSQHATPLLTAPPTLLQLPFFDDFSYNGPFPTEALWKTNNVYVNNHMSIESITHGVATFDAWNNHGVPYDTTNRFLAVWSDTLESHDIDLSSYATSDDIVLSFYVQQQGKGFPPHVNDSIALFFKNDLGNWIRMWVNGLQPTNDYLHVRVRFDETQFLHAAFAFRFINKAEKNVNNSNWNIDYVYLNTNRAANNNDINDVAITLASTSILKGYHNMPFHHFKANPSKYLADTLGLAIKNNSNTPQTANFQYNIKYNNTNLTQGTGSISTIANETKSASVNNLNAASLTAINDEKVSLLATYAITDPLNSGGQANDTLVLDYVFDQEFAYDDGTPELAYFLTMHNSYNIPAATAIKHELEVADTLRGFSIFMPQETPIQWNKEFTIRVYQSIAIDGNSDQLLYEESFFYPKFSDTVNQLVYYKLEQFVSLNAGSFYLTLVQPSGGFSDSLYVGFDVDRDSKEQRFVSTEGYWERSQLSGSLLFRPIVGKDFYLSIAPIRAEGPLCYPNPASNYLYIDASIPQPSYNIFNLAGQRVLNGTSNEIDISQLINGLYLIEVSSQNKSFPLVKFIKQ